VRRCGLLVVGFVCCVPSFAQIPPTAAEYAQYTGIFAAAARNDTTRIAKLIDAGEYAGIRDSHGRTPLHVATWRKRHDAMRVLAAATGDPNVLDGDGYDIVTIAAVANDVDTLRTALAIGCGPGNFVGPDDSTALIAAAQRGNDLPVRALIRAGAQRGHAQGTRCGARECEHCRSNRRYTPGAGQSSRLSRDDRDSRDCGREVAALRLAARVHA